MKKPGFYFLSALTLLLLQLAGCGGNESYISSSSSSATVPFSGVVEDGPIAGAKISLRDTDGTFYPLFDSLGHANYEVRTDEDGAFVLAVKAGTDLANLTVFAVGGIDSATGLDFKKLEMRSPLALFHGDITAIVVSPLTTLVAELHDQGLSFEDAENRLRAWLAVDVDLAAAPHTNLDLQRRALLLGKIALAITEATNDPKPFGCISKEILTTATLDDVIGNPTVMSALGIVDTETQIQLTELHKLLAAAATFDNMFFVLKHEELIHIFNANFKLMLTQSAPFSTLQNLNYQENVRVLADKTLLAAGSEVIPLVEPIPSRLFRYILFTYKLTTLESLTLDPSAFSANLTYGENDGKVALENDLWIALLAHSSSANSVNSPLLLNELPGDNNQRRLSYYYNSDLSSHFFSEQLIGRVSDDAISDAVLLKIVKERVTLGLFDDETTDVMDILIDTQIMSKESKGHAYLALANSLIKYNRLEEARSALNLARDFYLQVIKSKGYASASSADVVNVLATANAYRRAEDRLNVDLLDDELAEIAKALKTVDAIYYGKLITGIKNVVDAYISTGDFNAATRLVEMMIYYSDLTPQDKDKTTYKLRIYNWTESAKRCADLGKGEMVLPLYAKIKALRSTDAATSTATWVYVPDLIESLYRVGKPQEAMGLAKTIPSTSLYFGPAFKLSAPFEALQVQLETAFSIVDDYFPKTEDKLDVLTYYFAVKQKKPGIALALINANRFSEARQSLEKAEELLAGMQGTNLAKIRYGYVKLAELYVLIGDPIKAETLLQSAQKLIIDDIYFVPVMVDIALGYHNLNQTYIAQTILAEARSLADANPTWYRTDALPNLSQTEAATLLYETFVNAYEKIGEKDLLHTTALNFLLAWAQQIHIAGTVNDALAAKECEYLLRAALYFERSGYHADALNALTAAKDSAGQFAVPASRLKRYLNVIETYAAVKEYDQALNLAKDYLLLKSEYDQAIQVLANAYLNRDDFPETWVATIDSDGDGKPDFFNPFASAAEIAASGLILDDDCDGDGIVDTLDIRPLFKD